MIKSIYSNLLPKAVLLSVFLSPGYVISKAHANTDSISGIEQTNGKLSGRVIDAKGEPIPGANISVKGTTIGTITDMDGNFSIDVNPNQILTISFIGYETKTIPVSNQKTLNVVLQETVNQLDELVVVSYGTQKKKGFDRICFQDRCRRIRKFSCRTICPKTSRTGSRCTN